MRLVLTRSLWGLESNPERFGAAAREIAAGSEIWDAVSCPVQLVPRRSDLAAALASTGLELIPHLFTFGERPDEHLPQLDAALGKAFDFGALHAIGQIGRDRRSTTEMIDFLGRAIEIATRRGVRLAVETHRTRVLATPWTAIEILDALPELRLSVDLSHWVCVAESFDLPDELVDRVAERAVHLDARVGFEQGPQVADPRTPSAETPLEVFDTWWSRIWWDRFSKGADYLAITPEHGPPPYQPVDPATGKSLADVNEINEWLGARIHDRFRTPSALSDRPGGRT